MRADPTPWPSIGDYALAHPCPTCKVPRGEECVAPRKQALANQLNRIQESRGLEPMGDRQTESMHITRVDVGIRHYYRDVGNAPWSEDREPGRRYDSLGDDWSPQS